LTRKKICSFWWTSSNRRVTNMHHIFTHIILC